MSEPRSQTPNSMEDVSSNMPPPPPPNVFHAVSIQASESDSSSANTGKRKEMMPRSTAWDHFTKFTDEAGEIKVRCDHCEQVLAAHPNKNDTNQLVTHIIVCKKHPYRVETSRQTQLNFEGDNAKGGEANLTTWKFDQNALRKGLAYMIIVDELPFKFVEHPGFRKFMSTAQPKFKIPSRFTIARDCYQLYLDERSKLKEFFSTNKQRVCLTIDTWSSMQKINYMCLTAHFIDSDWNSRKRILNFCPISTHKGVGVGLTIEKCLIDWGIERIFTITVDNTSSNDEDMKHMKDISNNWGYSIMDGEHIHMRCVAHIINLVVVDGLKDVNASVIRVRAAVRYVRQSPARLQRFKECVAMENIECKSMLCLDVPMRWNSTYLMLEAAQNFERAFKRLEVVDPLFVSAHAEKYDVDGLGEEVIGVPTSEDWAICRRMVTILKNFYDLTLLLSCSSYVTCSTIFDELCSLDHLLRKLKDSPNLETSLMGDRMLKKYKKYWGNFDNTNILIYIASVLDPRYKLEYVCFTLEDTYGDQVGASLGKKVKDCLHSMYTSYCNLLAPPSQQGQSSRHNSSTERVEQLSIEDGFKKVKMERMMRYKKHKNDSGFAEKQSELERFLGEANEVLEEDNDDFDVLDWWRKNSHRFPILSQMARDVLAVPVSTVASESAFSTRGRILDSFRSSLTPNIVQALICAQNWFRGSSQPISIEENLQDIDKIEADLTKLSTESTVIDL